MKNFFSSLLAVIVGIILLNFIGFFLLLGIISVAGQDEEVVVKDKSIILLQLNGEVADRAKEQPFNLPQFAQFTPPAKIGLNHILEALNYAQDDDKIEGIVINLQNTQAGSAAIKEIRDAIKAFKKESGKFVYAFNHSYSQGNYYLSSVADSVFLNPEGDVELKGLSYSVMFFTDALAKLGIEPQIVRHGTFKAAVEPFMLKEMSEANKEQSNTFLSAIWNMMVSDISESRGITGAKINKIADELLVYTAKSAKEQKLVDQLLYRDQFTEKLMKLTDAKKEEDLNFISVSKYKKSIAPSVAERRRKKIAVVYGAGTIQMGQGSDEVISSKDFSAAIRKVRQDSTIKAVVLRVNSPGGSALASDIIWREIELLKKEKPVVVSMGDLAASGGYYISCNADYIVAQPSTLTGSIGVFGLFFTGQKLLEDKLGINTDGVKTNEYSDILSFDRPLKEKERALVKKSIEDIYQTFTSHVAEGRKMEQTKVLKLGEGRVWSGFDAHKNGLVDELGGLYTALEVAKAKAELEDYRIVEFPKQKDPIEELLEGLQTRVEASIIKKHLGANYKYIQRLEKVQQMQGPQARLPFFIDIE